MGFPRRGKADYYAPGEHNVACFQCGRKFKSSQMFQHWQGYLVCRDHWEPRHPQDFVKAVREDIVVPRAQPPADTFLTVCTACSRTAYADLGTADCMTVGNEPIQAQLDAFNCGLTLSVPSVPLTTCYTEIYESGLDDFDIVFGSNKTDLSVVSSPYGPAFFASLTYTAKYIRKTIPPIVMRKLTFYLWLASYLTTWDDATELALSNSGETESFYFNPVRESTYDAAQLTHVGCGTGTPPDYSLPAPKLPAEVWYYVEVIFEPAATSYTVTIYDAVTMAVVKTSTLVKNIAGLITVTYETYRVEEGLPNIPTKYADVRICDSIT